MAAGLTATYAKHRKAILAVGLGIVLYLAWRARQGGGLAGLTTSTDPTASTAADATGTTATDGSLGGAAGTGTIGATDQVAAALEGLSSGLTALQTQQANDAADTQSAFEQLMLLLGPSGSGPPSDSGPTSDPSGGDGSATPHPRATPAAAAGFWWNVNGKQTFVTKATAKQFLASEQSKGVSVDVWAANHPAAAASIGITPPPAPPPHKQPASPLPRATHPAAAPRAAQHKQAKKAAKKPLVYRGRH